MIGIPFYKQDEIFETFAHAPWDAPKCMKIVRSALDKLS